MNRPRHRTRGTAAIEMVLVLLLGTGALASLVLLGRMTWHAIAMQKAVASTGRIVSTLPRETLNTSGIADVIDPFIQTEVRAATLSAGLDTRPSLSSIESSCAAGGWNCGDMPVTQVQVRAAIRFNDTVFGNGFTGLLPESGLFFVAEYWQTYVP